MGDEKSIPEKLTDAISKAAESVKSAVSHVIGTASDAAQHAMEANAEKISRIPPARPDPEQVAGATNEQLYIPEANDAAAMPMPLFPAAPKSKMSTVGKKKKMAAKQTAKRSPAKKPTPSAGGKSVGKSKTKAVRKISKKSKR
jgi:hypothetical protein